MIVPSTVDIGIKRIIIYNLHVNMSYADLFWLLQIVSIDLVCNQVYILSLMNYYRDASSSGFLVLSAEATSKRSGDTAL